MADNEKMLETTKEEAALENDAERTRDCRCYVPRADIRETEEEVIIAVDMPGADESSVDITLEKDVLTINGTVNTSAPVNYSPTYIEYGIGDYQRRFVLSNEIDRNKIEAKVKNGVLFLKLPKAPEAKARKIAVKAA
jgi:HSP20 family molecular chaperone IbpA